MLLLLDLVYPSLYHVKWMVIQITTGWDGFIRIIKNGDEDHSVLVSPNFRSQQGGTTHHLTVHSVKHDGKYQYLVYTTRDGSVVDQLTHQVTITKGTEETSPSSLLDVLSGLLSQ